MAEPRRDDLALLGWSDHFARQRTPADAGLTIARVASEQRNSYLLMTGLGAAPAYVAQCSGRIFHEARGKGDLPGVGDFVLARVRPLEHRATIQRLLARRSKLARPERGGEQILASNVDAAFVCTSLNLDLSARRLERYLTLVGAAGVQPIVLLTKSDLADAGAIANAVRDVQTGAPGVPVHVLSAVDKSGLEQLAPYLTPGRTVVVVGSSGVGKSTLANLLADADLQDMMEIRAYDDKGRHCTTSRALIPLPTGALLIDTPGLRSLGIMDAAALATSFGDLMALERKCRFSNCRHEAEPACAVRAAIDAGTLEAQRVVIYLRLKAEAHAEAVRLEQMSYKQQRRRDRLSRIEKRAEPDRH